MNGGAASEHGTRIDTPLQEGAADMTDFAFLEEEQPLPEGHGHDHIVQWHVFRSRSAAETFARGIRLERDQRMVGGFSRDSVGVLYWVGVHVDDLEAWGNRSAVNKHGASS